MSPKFLPSILSADFGDFARDVNALLPLLRDAGVGGETIHVDVMDGHLVPNISFGPPVIAKLRKALPGVFFDTHLMIDEPVRYAAAMVKAGANRLTFHVEAPEVRNDLIGACKAIAAAGAKVGVTLKPATSVDVVVPLLPYVDLVLVMSVEPGFGGQSFMAEELAKVRTLRPLMRADQILEIDGGINEHTIGAAREAGVDWFVIGSALFDAPDRRATLAAMTKSMRDAKLEH